MDVQSIKAVLDLGLTGVLLVFIFKLWAYIGEKDKDNKDMREKFTDSYIKNTEAMTKFDNTIEESIKVQEKTTQMIAEITNILMKRE